MGPLHSDYPVAVSSCCLHAQSLRGWHKSQVFCSLRHKLSKQRLCRLQSSQQLTAQPCFGKCTKSSGKCQLCSQYYWVAHAGVKSTGVPVAASKVALSSDRMLLSAGSAGTAELPHVS